MSRLSRRELLALVGAASVARSAPAGAAPGGGSDAPLRAAAGSVALAEGAPATPVWVFDGVAPGPELRGALGERLALDVENATPKAITLRVFGLRGQSARVAIPAGGRGVLRAAPPDAGTFWYGAEDRRSDPRARGLAGAFVVEEPEDQPFDADRDFALVLDAWPVGPDGRLVAGPLAPTLLANGFSDLLEPAHPGERMRLRLVNAAPDRLFRLALEGWTGWVAALDGYPLAAVEPMTRLDLWPGQRADIVVDAPAAFGETSAIIDVADGAPRVLAAFVADGDPLDPLGYPPAPLAPGALPPLGDLGRATRIGLAAFAPGAAPVRVASGATVVIAVPVGGVAATVAVEGAALRRVEGPAPGPWRDVVGLAAGEAAEIAFVAAAAGDWAMERRPLDGAHVLRALLRVASALPL
jgi:FtsP/CotA-like multicopper oxidase with cupredoxin domain